MHQLACINADHSRFMLFDLFPVTTDGVSGRHLRQAASQSRYAQKDGLRDDMH